MDALFQLPNKFTLFNQTIKIKLSTTLIDEGYVSDHDYQKNVLTIQQVTNEFCKEKMHQVFWMEVSKYIFHSIGYTKLCDDRHMNDIIGSCISQYIEYILHNEFDNKKQSIDTFIPECFYLFGDKISVNFIDDLIESKTALGMCHFMSHVIEIQTPKEEYCRERLTQTFYHEFIHMVLYKLGYHKLSASEPLVDVYASAFHQVICSIFNNNKKGK